jgi:hypothetical protein
VRDDPPDAFVIDLARLPSHGRALAIWLRQQKATRHRPLIIVEGDRQKTAAVRELVPDAVYTSRSRLVGSVTRALANPPADPVVPGTMAGYSGAPLPAKLGIRAGATLALLDAPDDLDRTLGRLPDGVTVRRTARGCADVIVLFAASRATLERRFPPASRALAEGGRLWIAWPKRASGRGSDLTQAEVRRFGLRNGFVDYKIVAIDTTWSGLCFARRAARPPSRRDGKDHRC